MTIKSEEPYKTIGEIDKELELNNKKTGQLQTHTLRFWETQFKQIRPVIKAGKRRYYSQKNFEVIKFIKYLLKEKGLTINRAKKVLDSTKSNLLDDYVNLGVYKTDIKSTRVIKEKIKKISEIIKGLKDLK